MGFSLTGAHVIFFVAAVIVAGAVSGVFIAITMDVSSSLSERGDRLQEQLDTDFEIINDPNNIPSSGGYYIFYLKNIGKRRLETSNVTFQLFVDGEIIPIENYSFEDSSLPASNVTEIYIATSEISSGDRILRVVGPIAIEDEFAFKIWNGINMPETKSLVLERKGEKDGLAERFGLEIPNGSLIFIEGKEGTGKSIFW